jgi:hypothetical protein
MSTSPPIWYDVGSGETRVHFLGTRIAEICHSESSRSLFRATLYRTTDGQIVACVSKENPQFDRISHFEVFGADALIEASNTFKEAAVFASLDAAAHWIQPSFLSRALVEQLKEQ